MTIVTAINQPEGGYESIKTIESVTPEAVRLRYSSYMLDRHIDWSDHIPPASAWKPFSVYRTVLGTDLETATSYLQQFSRVISRAPSTPCQSAATRLVVWRRRRCRGGP